MGGYFFTCFLETLHTSLGHLEHLVLVVYPDVSSSHFSSTSVLHSTTSSSTSCTSCLVQHSDSYSVLQTSSPGVSQSLTRGCLQIWTVSLKAICSYSMKTGFSEVLFTVLFLLRLIVGDISGVTSLVIAVVTLDNIIILNLLHHFNLVNTSLAIRSWRSSSNISKAWCSTFRSLTLGTTGKRL